MKMIFFVILFLSFQIQAARVYNFSTQKFNIKVLIGEKGIARIEVYGYQENFGKNFTWTEAYKKMDEGHQYCGDSFCIEKLFEHELPYLHLQTTKLGWSFDAYAHTSYPQGSYTYDRFVDWAITQQYRVGLPSIGGWAQFSFAEDNRLLIEVFDAQKVLVKSWEEAWTERELSTSLNHESYDNIQASASVKKVIHFSFSECYFDFPCRNSWVSGSYFDFQWNGSEIKNSGPVDGKPVGYPWKK